MEKGSFARTTQNGATYGSSRVIPCEVLVAFVRGVEHFILDSTMDSQFHCITIIIPTRANLSASTLTIPVASVIHFWIACPFRSACWR